MQPELFKAHVAFHLTGKRLGAGLDTIDGLELRPALLAWYRDLTALRYDFPVVLVQRGRDEACVQSLSGVIDSIIHDAVPRDGERERFRKHLLRLEREIRALVAGGASGSLSALWDAAASRLGPGDESLEDSLGRARAALKADGELVDCDESMAARLLTHAWRTVQDQKARAFRENAGRLILKLTDILRVAHARSEAGQNEQSLKASVGTAHEDVFDFAVMSRLLTRALPKALLPGNRQRRIQWVLSVLGLQRFFPVTGGPTERSRAIEPYSFVFESCSSAVAAFHERLAELIEVAKAIAVGELEIEGHYLESKHDAFFAEFSEHMLGPKDFALFPDYLVRVRADTLQAAETAKLMEVLATGLPLKVLVRTDDILRESSLGDGYPAIGVSGARLASMAIGLNQVYVLQSSASNLFQFRDRILRGLRSSGPALFSVFSGVIRGAGGLPPYLAAAAAMQSRAFPAFSYDPSAGPDWASRFCLEDNPQAERDWPVQDFAYEGEERQRVSEPIAFTFIDFVACDPRYAGHFARIPHADWNGSMIPVGEGLAGETKGLPEKLPYVLMVDRNDVLQKVIVDDRLIQEARRCREMWHSLQELGGIHNSHAERLLARERKAWEEQKQRAGTPPRDAKTAAATPAAAPAAAATPAQAETVKEETPSDEAYIETPRCTTCDECTQINNRMFAYDANKQAYIASLDAGSYRDLVEAAESCQVSIIHPGKPRNPNEPGLDELIKRAEPFL